MPTLNISPNFTIDDIRAIRTHNYEMTKNMTDEERDAYYDRECRKAMSLLHRSGKKYAVESVSTPLVAAEPEEPYQKVVAK